MDVVASFDKLRMRTVLHGTSQMPFSMHLILSLSKDAEWKCNASIAFAGAKQ